MAYTHSRYKKPAGYRDGGAVPLCVEVDTPVAHVAADKLTEHMLPVVEAMEAPPVDEASAAFQKQIDALRQAEQVQRQRQAAPPALPESPEARLEIWKRQGISDDDAEHLNDLIEYPAITAEAVRDANRQGLNPNSMEFHQAVRASFANRIVARMHAPPEVNPVEEALEQARRDVTEGPDLSEPREVRTSGRSSFVSAPVSRETMANGSYNSYGERPGRVTLSIAQKEAAKIAGVSEAEYAANVLRLRQEKADGRYGGEQ